MLPAAASRVGRGGGRLRDAAGGPMEVVKVPPWLVRERVASPLPPSSQEVKSFLEIFLEENSIEIKLQWAIKCNFPQNLYNTG